MHDASVIELHRKERLDSILTSRSVEQKVRLRKQIPELIELERILLKAPDYARITLLSNIEKDGFNFPIYRIRVGNASPKTPKLLIVGGIHGIERIGTRVVVALLETWLQRMSWEKSLLHGLTEMEICFIPIANPVGMYLNTRANGNGVDLMRNSPVEAEGKVPFLVSGQTISRYISWYRGDYIKDHSLQKDHGEIAQYLEVENQILEKEVAALCEQSPLVMVLDCHSGFGFKDRLWFPYAYRRRPMKGIAPIMALKLLWDTCYPNHQYIFEPQSNQYLTHGDFWDYCYKKYSRPPDNHNFLPLTLEMGSWNWVKKKPSQLLSMEGLFNPMTAHREQRTLRRHLPLLDFLRHATLSYENWFPKPEQFNQLRQMANSLWYRED